MVAFIQYKPASSKRSWEDLPQDKLHSLRDKDQAITFAKSLAKHLNKNVRLAIGHEKASGMYFSPKMI